MQVMRGERGGRRLERKVRVAILFMLVGAVLAPPAPAEARHLSPHGQAHYAQSSATYGPRGTVVSVYATGVQATRTDAKGKTIRTEFVLVAGMNSYFGSTALPYSPCAENLSSLTGEVLSPDPAGNISTTSAPVTKPVGPWDLCFYEVTPAYYGSSISGSVSFIVTT
jgi:hypothetical protein